MLKRVIQLPLICCKAAVTSGYRNLKPWRWALAGRIRCPLTE